MEWQHISTAPLGEVVTIILPSGQIILEARQNRRNLEWVECRPRIDHGVVYREQPLQLTETPTHWMKITPPQKKEWMIAIQKCTWRTHEFTIQADTEDEAVDLALEDAEHFDFHNDPVTHPNNEEELSLINVKLKE